MGFLLVFIGPGGGGILNSFCPGVGIRPSKNCPGVLLGGMVMGNFEAEF